MKKDEEGNARLGFERVFGKEGKQGDEEEWPVQCMDAPPQANGRQE